MVERIKQIMEFYKLSPASFAEQIGINRSNLTHLFSGRNQPSLELAKKILHYYPEIKTEWLIMGVGQMLRNADDRELAMKMQHEKKQQPEFSEPDLFSVPESPVAIHRQEKEEISDSREVEEMQNIPQTVAPTAIHEENPPPLPYPIETSKVKQIVFFYEDKSFEVFHQR